MTQHHIGLSFFLLYKLHHVQQQNVGFVLELGCLLGLYVVVLVRHSQNHTVGPLGNLVHAPVTLKCQLTVHPSCFLFPELHGQP